MTQLKKERKKDDGWFEYRTFVSSIIGVGEGSVLEPSIFFFSCVMTNLIRIYPHHVTITWREYQKKVLRLFLKNIYFEIIFSTMISFFFKLVLLNKLINFLKSLLVLTNLVNAIQNEPHLILYLCCICVGLK